MARLVLCVLALLAVGGLTDPVKKTAPKVGDPVFVQRQFNLMNLFFRLQELNHEKSSETISKTWKLEKNIEHFANVSAVTNYIQMLEHKWVLPKAVPFSVHQKEHRFEAETLFNVLFSAKDYDTFYKTAVYLRERTNEYLYSYVLTVVIFQRKDTRGIFVPHIYEIFPSFFNNAEVMTTAQRINVQGFKDIDFYPSTYKWDDNVVIRWNVTIWAYARNHHDTPISYFTHDFKLNAVYYNWHVAEPSWLGGEVVPLDKDRRGEWFWFVHKQLLTLYYMERLSNGLGEIPDLGQEFVQDGYTPALLYNNGIPYPARPNHFHLDQPEFAEEIQAINDYERRIRDAIDQGYIVNNVGEHINLRVTEAIEDLARIIEGNVDSPNTKYYRNFINIWKKVLGNSIIHEHHTNENYYHQYMPLVVPSVLEHYQTALRDPAFYMIWKRVLNLFQLWQEQLPHYKREELALPQVAIKKVDVDKLVTYFEYTYMNISSYLHSTKEESKHSGSILVQRPRLNHKVFQVRVSVKSEVAKSVVVRFFLAPKYNSHGGEIPLSTNSQNFFMFDEFVHDLPAGESVITRNSDDNVNLGEEWPTTYEVYEKVQKALHDKGQFVINKFDDLIQVPQHLVLPKGRVGGMPFVLMVYISEYRAPAIPLGTGFDPSTSFGFDTGARYLTDDPLGFPLNKPLYPWQVEGLHNIVFQDVLIYHKHSPEIVVPHME